MLFIDFLFLNGVLIFVFPVAIFLPIPTGSRPATSTIWVICYVAKYAKLSLTETE